eukprot:2544713-Pleurochrysis_carterae.AAC.1
MAKVAAHIANDGARRIVKKLDADLGDVTGLASAAEHLCHLCELNWLILHHICTGQQSEAAVER